MTCEQIRKMMADVVIQKQNLCHSTIDKLTNESKTEKKALMIEKGMYDLCLNGGLLYNASLNDPDAVTKLRLRRMNNMLQRFLPLLKHFQKADQEEQLRMTAALEGEIWMLDQILMPYRKELSLAKESGDAEQIFELNIKTSVVEAVLNDWKNLRHKYGLYTDLTREIKQ